MASPGRHTSNFFWLDKNMAILIWNLLESMKNCAQFKVEQLEGNNEVSIDNGKRLLELHLGWWGIDTKLQKTLWYDCCFQSDLPKKKGHFLGGKWPFWYLASHWWWKWVLGNSLTYQTHIVLFAGFANHRLVRCTGMVRHLLRSLLIRESLPP